MGLVMMAGRLIILPDPAIGAWTRLIAIGLAGLATYAIVLIPFRDVILGRFRRGRAA